MRALIILLLLSGSASAHSWYPNECCHAGDCKHSRPGEVVFTDAGIVVRAGTTNPKGQTLQNDITVPYGHYKIKRFPPEAYDPGWGPNDGGIHICTFHVDATETTKMSEGVRCIFMDPGV